MDGRKARKYMMMLGSSSDQFLQLYYLQAHPITQSKHHPLEDGVRHLPFTTGDVTTIVTYVTHPSSGHC